MIQSTHAIGTLTGPFENLVIKNKTEVPNKKFQNCNSKLAYNTKSQNTTPLHAKVDQQWAKITDIAAIWEVVIKPWEEGTGIFFQNLEKRKVLTDT